MKYLRIIFCLALILSFSISSAQQEDYGKKEKKVDKVPQEDKFEYNSSNPDKKWDWSKARIGGNFGLSFNNRGLFIDASPTFGYKINRVVELGAGFKTLYYRQKDFYTDGVNFYDYSSLTYGPLAYGRFTIWDGIFAMAQYEMANKNPINISSIDESNQRLNVHHLLIGGGYSTSIGGAGNLNISLLYDVIDHPESIYQFGTFGDFPLLLNISVGFGINR